MVALLHHAVDGLTMDMGRVMISLTTTSCSRWSHHYIILLMVLHATRYIPWDGTHHGSDGVVVLHGLLLLPHGTRLHHGPHGSSSSTGDGHRME